MREHFEAVARVIGFIMNPKNKGKRVMDQPALP